MKRVSANVDQIQAFVTTNNVGIMINAGANANNFLIKVYAIKDLFGILVIVSVNVINHVMLVNIQTKNTVSAGKNQLINQLNAVPLSTAPLKNVLKMLKE